MKPCSWVCTGIVTLSIVGRVHGNRDVIVSRTDVTMIFTRLVAD